MNYNISINDELAIIVDRIMKERKYANRSEFFRDLIRKFYIDEGNSIEEIDVNDPDYELVKTREKDAKFMNINDLINEL